MKEFLDQIRAADASKLYYISLACTLMLPDICGALEAPNGIANRARYAQWFNNYVSAKYHGTLDGETSYWFRCSFLHQGSTQHRNSRYSQIVFLEPNSSGMVVHNNIMNDVLNVDLHTFIEDVISGVEAWLPTAQQLPYFASNFSRFIAYRTGGFAISISGTPWIG